MAQPTLAPSVSLSQVAGKLLVAWRTGEACDLHRELENVRSFAAKARPANTLEMETMEVLSGAVESLRESRGKHAGAVRLLEHIAQNAGPSALL